MNPQEVFAALGDPTRFEVLSRLADGGPASASALAEALPVSRQAIAKHLAALEEVGLVERSRQGREVVFTVDSGPLSEVAMWAGQIGSQWDHRLERLKRAVD
jgi:DNA-binding transcriptional ArsR family regulator